MQTLLRYALALGVGLLFAFFAAESAAGPSQAELDRARALFEEGETFYKVGEYDKALESYKQAYILSKEPALLFNMAQCYRLLSRSDEAVRTYKIFIRDTPDEVAR